MQGSCKWESLFYAVSCQHLQRQNTIVWGEMQACSPRRRRTTFVSLFCLQRDLGRWVSNWKEIPIRLWDPFFTVWCEGRICPFHALCGRWGLWGHSELRKKKWVHEVGKPLVQIVTLTTVSGTRNWSPWAWYLPKEGRHRVVAWKPLPWPSGLGAAVLQLLLAAWLLCSQGKWLLCRLPAHGELWSAGPASVFTLCVCVKAM